MRTTQPHSKNRKWNFGFALGIGVYGLILWAIVHVGLTRLLYGHWPTETSDYWVHTFLMLTVGAYLALDWKRILSK